jgi:hypothetical protein
MVNKLACKRALEMERDVREISAACFNHDTKVQHKSSRVKSTMKGEERHIGRSAHYW